MREQVIFNDYRYFEYKGGGNAPKRRRMNTLIKNDGAVVFFIHETKLANMQDFCAKSLWSNTSIGYSFSNSTGLSGGLITL